MRALWPVAAITFKEGVRNRALYGVALLALMLQAVNLLISGMIMRQVGKVAVDIALSAASFGGLLVVLFVGINLLTRDLDSKTIYSVISRPISKCQYLLGKFFGVILVVFVSMFFLSLSSVLSIFLVKISYPNYFDRFAWTPVLLAFVMLFLMFVVLVSLSFLFASLSSAPFIAFVLTVICYLIGHSVAEVKKLIEVGEVIGVSGLDTIQAMVGVAYYVFPNLSLFDIKLQAAHALPISMTHVFWVTAYALSYSAVAMLLAAFVFHRREFP